MKFLQLSFVQAGKMLPEGLINSLYLHDVKYLCSLSVITRNNLRKITAHVIYDVDVSSGPGGCARGTC